MINTANYDTLTLEELTGVVGKKWTTFPDTIGAFIAEMDFRTAPSVIAALRETVDNGFFGYLPVAMEEGLAKVCAGWYEQNTDWAVPAERVHSLPDVLKGLEITLRLYAPKGGKVIVPTPAYMPFLTVPQVHDREIVQVPMLKNDGRWEYDLDALDAAFTDGAEVLILCNPFNPIGRVMTREEMLAISEIVDRHGGRVFSDEIHAPIVYEGHRHVPYASISETAASHTITAIAASKAWNLAGLKTAQIVISNDADEAIWQDTGAHLGHGASTLGVIASIAAYTTGQEWLDGVLAYLDGNRRWLEEAVGERLPGVCYTVPEGTYLAWLDFCQSGLAGDLLDGDLAQYFRENARVAVVDGGACGNVGKGCVRFNFAMPRPILERAIDQMAAAIQVKQPA
ncbi:MAG TPA: aminotransferase class I/II-fold pyridoxal phosphate-dependent enzyme [Thermomicrobiales bacterium]|nr:aminotransferase class I/II-fold pyridoxal phosphate-dependent enzyme [Thermomicrobiales bacterium]